MQVNNLITRGAGGTDPYGLKADSGSNSGAIRGSKIYGGRGVFAGGSTPGTPGGFNTMDYYNIGIGGDALDFGDASATVKNNGIAGDGYRALIAGGKFANSETANIDYFNILMPGNSTDWGGDLQASKAYGTASSNGHRAVFTGGAPGTWPAAPNQQDMVEFHTKANAIDFGEATVSRIFASSCSDNARMLTMDQYVEPHSAYGKSIDYFSFTHNSGGASDFGDLRQNNYDGGSCSNLHRGFHVGGWPSQTFIDYMNISTPGDAGDFGDLPSTANGPACGSDGSRACISSLAPTNNDGIGYFNIGVLGNAVDYGTLTVARYNNDHTVSGG